MTREDSWQVEGTTLTLLRHISSLGYVVSVHRIAESLTGNVGAFVEMHAVDPRTEQQHVARIGTVEGGDADYRCAYLLGQNIGIVLDDG